MQRGEITSDELKELEDIAVQNKEISKERLEKVFYKAFIFIDELAKKRKIDPAVLENLKKITPSNYIGDRSF